MKRDHDRDVERQRKASAPAVGSVWTTLGGLRCRAVVSVRPAPPDAPQIVLVHGFAVSSRYMLPTAERLAGHYPVFAPDLPGYGLSAEPEHVLDVPELAAFLAEWMTRRKIDRAVLVGNSFGCQIIAELARRFPERVSHAVMIGPTADASARTLHQHIWRLARDLFHEPFALWLIQGRDYLDFGLRWQWKTARYMLDDRIEDKLPLLRMPVLVLRGEHDPIAPQTWVEELARLAPDGTLAEVAGASHAVNYTSPDALVAEIERFLAGHGMTERRWVDLDGARLHYQRSGTGEPVVLIHGLSASSRWWARNVDALADRFTVYVIDLLGFGRSRGRKRFVLAEAAALLARWMDAVEIDRAHIVGHSMGGLIAAQLAAEYPEKVARLVLVDAAVPLPRQHRLLHMSHLGRELRYTPLRFLPLLATDAVRAGPRTVWGAFNQLLAADIERELSKIKVPVLLIWGEHDTLVPPGIADRLTELIPHAQRVVIDGAGHKPMLERPTAFNDALIGFLTAP